MNRLLSSPAVATPLLACLLFVPSLGAQEKDSSAVSLHIPDSIGVFAKTERKDFDDPSLGVLLRYQRADSLRVDVFVYPGPDLATDCPVDCALKVIDDEVDTFISAFPEMIKRGYDDSIAIVVRRPLEATAADRWRVGRYLRLRTVSKGVVQNSDYYLYFLPGFRVKLRASYPVDSATAIAVSEFSRLAVPALLAAPAVAKAADGEGKHIAMSVTLPGKPPELFAQLVTALVKQGYTIADSSRADGRIVTAPSMKWPAGTEKEKWHGAESPGVVIGVNLRAKGDSTAVEIGGQSPTVAGWKDASVATQLELISVVMLANELPKAKPR